MANNGSSKNETGIRILPPFIFLSAIVAALVLNWIFPIHVVPDIIQQPLGFLILACGLAPLPWLFGAFKHADTSIDPRIKPTNLITDGAYAKSRNPIYVAMIAISLGIGILNDAIWIIPTVWMAVHYLTRTVIEVEEAFLEAAFGADYVGYKTRVRRWL